MRFQRHTQPAPQPEQQAPQFAAGHFTALVRQHDWPPGFVSQFMPGRNFEPLAAASRANVRAGVGFAGVDLGLPGATVHVQRWRAADGRAVEA